MIGGRVALALAPNVLSEVSRGRRCVTVTGTNGKSTTTRMIRAALSTRGQVASNVNGDNMPPGIVSAFMMAPRAQFAALEVDEMHLPIVAGQVNPAVMVLLNLSRDQLDRVGEIGTVERRLRQAVNAHPDATIVANCDDPLIASAAWDAKSVIWVAAGTTWGADSAGFPRGGRLVRQGDDWHVVGADHPYRRPEPDWWLEKVEASGQATLRSREGHATDVKLNLPGAANLGNAAHAIVAAHQVGVDIDDASRAIGEVREVAGRYSTHEVNGRRVRMMLAKNPAGWQEAMTMVDATANGLVIAVNGQIPDGEDLSWLWDVDFSVLQQYPCAERVVASGERAADLAVRLEYAGIHCECVPDTIEALTRCAEGRIEFLANYTSFRDTKREIDRREKERHAGTQGTQTTAEGGRDE